LNVTILGVEVSFSWLRQKGHRASGDRQGWRLAALYTVGKAGTWHPRGHMCVVVSLKKQVEAVSLIKVHYAHAWKYHNETPL
jgi:hypothetical protein